MNADDLIAPAYACPVQGCPCVFVSPNARLHHLEEAHGETPDTSGAASAVAQLHALLERVARKYGRLP